MCYSRPNDQTHHSLTFIREPQVSHTSSTRTVIYSRMLVITGIIYRGEPPSPRPEFQQGTPWTDLRNQLGSDTSKTEGGGAHGQVGRPGRSAGLPVGPPTFSFFSWAAFGVHLLMVVVWALALLNFFSGGLLIHVWRCLISRCLLLSQKGMIVLHFQLKPALIEI